MATQLDELWEDIRELRVELGRSFDEAKASFILLAVERGELTHAQAIRIMRGASWSEATEVAA